jgi:hypothetical protein
MGKIILDFINAHFWVFYLFTIAASAYFLADGTSELVAAELFAELRQGKRDSNNTSKTLTHSGETYRFEKKSGLPILERNIFDSVTGPVSPYADVEQEWEEEEDLEDEDLPLIPCEENTLKLLATVVSSCSPNWSFVTVSDGKEKSLHRMGDKAGDREVSWISWRYLFLKGPDDICYIDLFGEENLSCKNRKKRSPRKAQASIQKDDFKNGIRVVSQNERIVDRSLVDKIMGDPIKFMKGSRFRPHRKDGKIVGFRLRRMSSKSPLSLLGAKRGDVINGINGIQLTSMDKALQAYQRLKSTDDLVFYITRRGKPMELKIAIQ